MKNNIKTVLLGGALLFAGSLKAQTLVQPPCVINAVANNYGSYMCTFNNPNKQGDTLVLAEVGQIASITDLQGNQWNEGMSRPQLGFWYAQNVKAGPNSVVVNLVTPGAFDGIFAEYPAASSVQVSPMASGSGENPVSGPLLAPAGNIVLGFGSQWTNSWEPPSAPGTGFVMEAARGFYLEDEVNVPAGNVEASAAYSNPVNWFVGVAVLSTAPPIPPINLPVTGTLLFDDGSVVYNGQIIPEQLNPNTNAYVPAGAVTSDANGNLTGMFMLNPNLVDATGSVTVQLSLPNIGVVGTFTQYLAKFQQGQTSIQINEVLFKTLFMTQLKAVDKSTSVALLP
jgi:hypothetical protein